MGAIHGAIDQNASQIFNRRLVLASDLNASDEYGLRVDERRVKSSISKQKVFLSRGHSIQVYDMACKPCVSLA
jgi:hypothetical protein